MTRKGADRPGIRRRDLVAAAAPLAITAAASTGFARRVFAQTAPIELTFGSAPFFTAESIAELLDAYNTSQNSVRVSYIELPSAGESETLHADLVRRLETDEDAPDVFSLDLVKIAAFAEAGLSLPLEGLFSADDRDDFMPGILEACTVNGDQVAAPWFADCGMLFYRRDILERLGADVPETWDDLTATASAGTDDTVPHGYLWQGKRSEALVCNAVSVIGSNGGSILTADGHVGIAEPEAIAAIQFLHDTINGSGISPASVLEWDEEPSRRPFDAGKAVFLRNWSYTWALAQFPGSSITDTIGVAPLPHFPGKAGATCLGGFQYAVNARSANAEAATDFLRWLTSPETQLRFATVDALAPTRLSIFDRPELADAQPFLSRLRNVFVGAVPRPVTHRYGAVTEVVQEEVSRALSTGDIEGSLVAAQAKLDAILRS